MVTVSVLSAVTVSSLILTLVFTQSIDAEAVSVAESLLVTLISALKLDAVDRSAETNRSLVYATSKLADTVMSAEMFRFLLAVTVKLETDCRFAVTSNTVTLSTVRVNGAGRLGRVSGVDANLGTGGVSLAQVTPV